MPAQSCVTTRHDLAGQVRYNTPMRRPRFQFRLLTLFAITAVAAYLSLWWSTYRENAKHPYLEQGENYEEFSNAEYKKRNPDP
jgi:hypothetical protein